MEDMRQIEYYNFNRLYFYEHYCDLILNMESNVEFKDELNLTNFNVEILKKIKEEKSKKLRKELIEFKSDLFSFLTSMINISQRIDFIITEKPIHFEESIIFSNPSDLVNILYTKMREFDLLIAGADTFYNLRKMEDFINREKEKLEVIKKSLYFPHVFYEQNKILQVLVKNRYITEEEINLKLRNLDPSRYMKLRFPEQKTYIKFHDAESLVCRESDDVSIYTMCDFTSNVEELCYKYRNILQEVYEKFLDK